MTTKDDRVRQAGKLIDQHEFDQAIRLLKAIIELEGPEKFALTSLVIAWEEEHLAFLDTLIAQSPEEYAFYREKIKILMISGRTVNFKAAILLCSKAIEKFREHNGLEALFRAMRFQTALKAHEETYLADDFMRVWQFRTKEKVSPHLIQQILSISDPRLASVFSTLIESGLFSEEIQQLFQHKIEQLALFEKVFPPESDPRGIIHEI